MKRIEEELKKDNEKANFFLIDELGYYSKKNYTEKEEILINRVLEEAKLIINYSLIIKYLYIYNKEIKKTNILFRCEMNNLYLLFCLGLTNINPIKYDLPYELYENHLYFDFIGSNVYDFILWFNYTNDKYLIVNFSSNNYYLILKEDYLKEKTIINKNGIPVVTSSSNTFLYLSIQNSYVNYWCNSDVKYLIKKLKPKSADDYAKILGLYKTDSVWTNNQDELFDKHKITLKQLISSTEDVYNYLKDHSINNDKLLEITKFIEDGKASKLDNEENYKKWLEYKDILKEHNCDNWFIDVCTKILFLWPKGFLLSIYLYYKELKHEIL